MMKRSIVLGLALGIVAGVLDIIPMIAWKMTWDAVLAAFFLWVVVGFMVSTSALTIPPILKGIVIALLCLLPSLFIIGWQAPSSLVPVIVITIVLGALIGYGHRALFGRDLGIVHNSPVE